MAFPFKSEGVSGRPISHRRAKLSEVLSAKLARLARGSRVQRELADRVRLIFDPLEPRLLLNADLNVNLATDGVDIDHQILVRLIEEVENVNNVATTIQRVEIVDQARGETTVSVRDAAAFRMNEKDRAWADSLANPQPIGTFLEKIRLSGARDRVARKAYIRAVGYPNVSFEKFHARATADPSWRTYEVNCGHHVMIDEPDRLTEILLEVG